MQIIGAAVGAAESHATIIHHIDNLDKQPQKHNHSTVRCRVSSDDTTIPYLFHVCCAYTFVTAQQSEQQVPTNNNNNNKPFDVTHIVRRLYAHLHKYV